MTLDQRPRILEERPTKGMKAVYLERTPGKAGQVYYPILVKSVPEPTLNTTSDGVIVKVLAAALNHRDLFQRQSLYPGIDASIPMCADGVGMLVSSSTSTPLLNKRVLICPGIGWAEADDGPEGPYLILGATKGAPGGTLSEKIALPSHNDVVACPAHLSDIEAAALPLAGLTAYRALFIKAGAKKGQTILITGIGGGVALMALQFAVAAGVNVWVTSGTQDKIDKAVKLGAKGGVTYKDPKWNTLLKEKLGRGVVLDAVIDSGGGNIVEMVVPLLKLGGKVSCYGMTTLKSVTVPMTAVMKNIEVRGSTMGSNKEFADMVAFVGKTGVRPVVEHVFHGLDQADQAFTLMKDGAQFGKIVVTVTSTESAKI